MPPDRPREGRNARRKQQTRERLIEAALVVMGRQGPEAATVNAITEEADVGFGSFYNHFQSKDEIRAAVTNEMLDRFGAKLDHVADVIADPVEVIAASMRLVLMTLANKPDWADFLANGGQIPAIPEKGLIPRLRRDIEIAIAADRLKVADLPLTMEAMTGALPAMLKAMRRGAISPGEAPRRITAMALRLLAVGEDEIADLVGRPLPQLPPGD